MNRFSAILLVIAGSISLNITAQTKPAQPPKINDVFFEYMSRTLRLTPTESMQMRPLVNKYLNDRKKIIAGFSDPLEREQQILSLKVRSRKKMVPVIGMQKANAFFSGEQTFRRKVRE